ncbi:MAG: hypothetical protein NVSMB19_15980 [Vulcanimicrobiaceae bacterium]
MSLTIVPTAGSPVLVSAPAPNPVAYNFAAGQVASAAQVDTNFYGVWNHLATLSSQLNGVTYCPGPAFSSAVLTAPITGSVDPPVAGAGTVLRLSLAHGDYDDLANAQTIAGQKTYSAAIIASAGVVGGPAANPMGFGTDLAAVTPGANNSGEGGANFQVAAGSLFGHRFFKWDGVARTLLAQIDQTGAILASSPVNGSLARVPAMLNTSGNATGGTPRILFLTATAPGTTTTVTWTGSFTNSATYIALVTDQTSGATMTALLNFTGTSFNISNTIAGHAYAIVIIGY